MGKRITVRVTVRLDVEHDADLISWLAGSAPGSRSVLIRAAWRAGLRNPPRWEPVDVEELRRVMAEELAQALAGRRVTTAPPDPPTEESQVDRKPGSAASSTGCWAGSQQAASAQMKRRDRLE